MARPDCWVARVELEEVIGKQAAKLLCAHFGGLRQYIPQKANAYHPFASLLGMLDLTLLCERYGGVSITLPNGRNEPGKEEIIKAIEKGEKTMRDIALEFGVTERWVWRLASQMKQDMQQLRLM